MNNKITLIIIAVILIVTSFFGGMQYGKNNAASVASAARANFAGGNFAGRTRGAGAGGGFTGGQIISIGTDNLTMTQQGGGSKIVLITNSTPVMKTVSGTVGDLSVGTNITVTGASNSDGSISASAIQIRPATTTRAQ